VALTLAMPAAGSPARAQALASADESPPPWAWPIPGAGTTTGFQAPATPWGPGHPGLDMAALPGTPVLAPTGGRIAFAGRVAGRGIITISADGTGSPAERLTLEPVDPSVRTGQHVQAGERIGSVGTGGHCSQRCLHLGLRVQGAYRDPWPRLAGRGPVLKPP